MNEQSRPDSSSSSGSPAITVNGRHRPLGPIAPHTTTLDWMRTNGLTGCKEGCAEGECGACAVMVATPDGAGGTGWASVNSCLVPVAALNGQEVVTAEGLASAAQAHPAQTHPAQAHPGQAHPEQAHSGHLHPVQEQMAANGSSQCGYCTAGFVCSMASEFYRRDRTAAETPQAAGTIEATAEATAERGPNGFDLHALGGNLCRCTGYRPIRDAAYALGDPDPADALAARRDQPPPAPVATDVTGTGGRFVRPPSLTDALGLLAEHPDAMVVAGATDWGVEVNLRGRRSPLVVAVERLPELCSLSSLTRDGGGEVIEIGAGMTLSAVERELAGRIPILNELFPQFASRLIRNRATIGGNLGTGSPIGDAAPALLALDASVVLVSAGGEREVPLEEYFTGYRKTVCGSDELIRSVRVPLPTAPITAFHKIAKRRFDDISSIAVAFAIQVDDGVVTRAAIGLGGVAATPLRAHATEAALLGNAWDEQTVTEASAALGAEGTPMDDHRASAAYRRIMLSQALPRLYAGTDDGRASASQEVSA